MLTHVLNATQIFNPKCILTHRDELSVKWVEDKLTLDRCDCDSLARANSGIFHCMKFPFEHPLPIQLFYIAMFSLLILLSCAGNLATGFSGTYNLYYYWAFSKAHCAFNNLMGITPICASVFTMIVMSIDRYLAIVYPLRRRPGRGRTISIIAGIWILAFICGLPALGISDVEVLYFIELKNEIDPTYKHQPYNIFEDRYNHSLVVMQYMLPLIILSFTYGRVAYVLKQKDSIGDTRHYDNLKAKRKAANMLALVVFTFIFMWLPYNLYFLLLNQWLAAHLSVQSTLHVYINIYCLGMASCILNPVIYYHMNERFRLGFRYAFRWLPCIKVRREDYEIVFSNGSRVSYPTAASTQSIHTQSRLSMANTVFSSNHPPHPQRPKTSLQHQPMSR